jgi:hypothetical protein
VSRPPRIAMTIVMTSETKSAGRLKESMTIFS